jgi:hypothetical protein
MRESGMLPPRPSVSESPEWGLVLRMAATQRFSRSALLTKFLLYVSERALSGQSSGINEHQIGIHVFGRDDRFKRSDDNIVRNYARILRKRINDYFLNEGQQEPLRLSIPRGGYVPIFEPRSEAEPKTAEAYPEQPAQSTSPESSRQLSREGDRHPQRTALQLGLALFLGLAAGVALTMLRPTVWLHSESQTSKLNQLFWQSIFTPAHSTIVVPSDGGLVILSRFIEASPTLSDYVKGAYHSPEIIASGLHELTHTTSRSEIPRLSQKIETLGERRYTSIVDLDLTVRLSRIAEVHPEKLIVRFARDLRMDDLKTENAVLIGSADSNPWVELFQPQLNFQFMTGGAFGGSATIVNRRPLPGERLTYASVTGDPAKRTYGVIAYVPNLNGSGRVLILEGINMAGTEAAGEFLLNPELMASVIARARKPTGALRSFEVLVETGDVAANSSQLKVLSQRYSES